MGLCYSNNPNTPNSNRRRINSSSVDTENDSGIFVNSANKYDEEAIRILKNDFNENPEIFVLNNLITSVMFFENYEREINELSNVSKKDKLNLKLIKEQSKQCLMPDVVFERVNKNVKFRRLHGPKKCIAEPLAPQRLYVIYDNIEVMDPNDNYSGIDDNSSYRVHLEESNRKGFVKLQQSQYLKTNKYAGSDDSGNITSRSSMSSEEKDGVSVQLNNKTKEGTYGLPNSIATTSNYDSSDSEYAAITQSKTPKPLKTIASSSNSIRLSNSLPSDCFKQYKVKNYKNIDELEVYNREDEDKKDLFKIVMYISSASFMDHFKDVDFPNSLGRDLGLKTEEINKATSIPGTIFCDRLDNMHNKIRQEIIPAVEIQWPSHLTYEWKMRDDRPTIIDKRTTRLYKWPTDTMINNISKLECVVMPKGYVSKKEDNKASIIEWEVGFPKAEKYIETRMSHAQMRCFLVILTLYKTFIQPRTLTHGLLIEHIRILMYWQCEENYLKWTENKLGSKILQILKRLKQHLAKCQLSDYFIREKNVFENIPRKYLIDNQIFLHNLIESPLMYFISALRNLSYTSEKFYPSLNFKELNEILTSEGIMKANPLLYQTLQEDRDRNKHSISAENEWNMRFQKEIRNKKLKEQEKQKQAEKEVRASIDSINLEWKFEKELDIYKKRSILIFFIKHFVEMAITSMRLSTTNQTLFYLKHSWYLTKILEDVNGCESDVIEHQEKIKKLEDKVKKRAAFEQTVPLTPHRNPIQQVKGNNINLHNLNQSYDRMLLQEVVPRKVKYNSNYKRVNSDDNKSTIRNSYPSTEQRSETNIRRRSSVHFSAEVTCK